MKNISNKVLLLCVVWVILIICSCNSNNNSSTTSSQDSLASVDTSKTIQVTPLPHAKDFPGAMLKIASLNAEKLSNDSAKVTIKYTVQNFNLTDQTEHEHHMANSTEGQHIHFILNNTPYIALYKPEHTFTLPINSEHYLLSFLSRSFHESIKTSDAYKLVKFKVNADGQIEEQNTPTEPSLFYSRPKGDYKGEDTKSVLLDFFLVNTDISPESTKVKAVINGQEFVLDRWIPYEISNLPKGDATIQLTLINAEGSALTGDNVTIQRKCNISE